MTAEIIRLVPRLTFTKMQARVVTLLDKLDGLDFEISLGVDRPPLTVDEVTKMPRTDKNYGLLHAVKVVIENNLKEKTA